MAINADEYSLPEERFDPHKEFSPPPPEYAELLPTVPAKKSALGRVLVFSSALILASGSVLGAVTAEEDSLQETLAATPPPIETPAESPLPTPMLSSPSGSE